MSTDWLCRSGTGPRPGCRQFVSVGVVVLDIVYIAATIAVFAVIALVARGVEKL